MEKLQFTLTSAFLHKPMVIQLIPESYRTQLSKQIAEYNAADEHYASIFSHTTLTDAVLEMLNSNTRIKSLEEMLIKNAEVCTGQLVWIEQDFYFRGATKKEGYAEFYQNVKRFDDIRISGRFNIEHLFGVSSADRLSRRKTVFMFAYLEAVKEKEIVLRPILIGDKLINDVSGFHRVTDYLKVTIEDIDEFSLAAVVKPTQVNIEMNRDISETQLKKWFGELINHGHVPKDWGGEYSDMFTNRLHIEGTRVNAAFLLKGPSKFHPMVTKDLGKNGDQITRLFDEPADLYILQHCHYVKADIYKNMKAFAAQFDRIKRYCIIDGIDTLRILKAYGKI